MSKEIKNRRENILINEIPPEILTEEKLSADGYVKNTDYASASSGGVIKISGQRATSITTGGVLSCNILNAADFTSANNGIFISKGTLENVFAGLIQQYIKAIFLANVMEPDTSKEYAVTMGYSEILQEWNLEFEEL